MVCGMHDELGHGADSVIESSLWEIIGSKNFSLINLSFNSCETTIYDNKVFLENLVPVHYNSISNYYGFSEIMFLLRFRRISEMTCT